MTSHGRYRLFGLCLDSALELPELPEAEPGCAADLIVALAPPAPPSHPAGLHDLGDALLLVIEGVASFRVAGGRDILVTPVGAVPDRNLRLFLLGSAMALVLHQRGVLPLHANAVVIDGRAFAFMGRSGAGKSTLAGWFHDHGFAVLADDVSVIEPMPDGPPLLRSGIPRLRLWRDALEASDRKVVDYERSYTGDDPFEKYDVPLDGLSIESAPLAAVFVLDRGEPAGIFPLDGVAAAEAVYDHTYRGAYLQFTGKGREHWQSCLHVVRQVPILSFRRSFDRSRFDDEAALALAQARHLLAP